MSYENLPKNSDKTKILTEPFDYGVAVTRGEIEGADVGAIRGRSFTLPTNYQTLWDNTFDLTRLVAPTQLYVSSTSASDTGITVIIQGLDGDYNPVTATAVLNGQTQQALDTNLLRVQSTAISGTTKAQGDIYIAEADTLTGGVPDTNSKVQSKIGQFLGESGDFSHLGNSNNGFITVPAGKQLHLVDIIASCPSKDEIAITLWAKGEQTVWQDLITIFLYESSIVASVAPRVSVKEKTDLEFRVSSNVNNGYLDCQLYYYLTDYTAP